MSGIVWKKQDSDIEIAYRNENIIGYVFKRPNGDWFYSLNAFHPVDKRRGGATKALAKRSFIRAWEDWLSYLGLEIVEGRA